MIMKMIEIVSMSDLADRWVVYTLHLAGGGREGWKRSLLSTKTFRLKK